MIKTFLMFIYLIYLAFCIQEELKFGDQHIKDFEKYAFVNNSNTCIKFKDQFFFFFQK